MIKKKKKKKEFKKKKKPREDLSNKENIQLSSGTRVPAVVSWGLTGLEKTASIFKFPG